jgi:CheY-like chemotaxis protein
LEDRLVYRRKQPARILLVEDDADDAAVIESALENSPVDIELDVTGDGETALEHLADHAENVGLPNLILLDVGLPGMSGFEVLERVKTTEKLRRIPVIMLTQFDAMPKALQAYRHRANSYISKPQSSNDLQRFVERIAGYWLDLAVLPDGSTGTGDG